MPLYEYECPECSKKFEIRRSINESDIDLKCPACRKGKLKRVLSLFSTTSSEGSCAPTGST